LASNNVSVIDTSTNAVTDTIPEEEVGDSPLGAVVSPDGSTLFVTTNTNAENGNVLEIDTATNKHTGATAAGNAPTGLTNSIP
jgi:YVTN family beta-propeller protein